MIAVDTNILVYAHRRDSSWHDAASGCVRQLARIAALCLDHGVRELWTADRDFGRFATLTTRNPLV